MKTILFTSVCVLLAVLLGPLAHASAQGTDPVSVIEGFVSALNAGNEDAAMAFYANDAVRTRVPSPIPGTSGIYVGTDDIRKDLKTQLAANVQIKNSNYQVNGDKVTWTARFSNDTTNKLGISPLDAVGEATVLGGKIKTHTTTLTPESLAKQKAAQAAQSAPATLPTTGAELSVGAAWPLAIAGLVLLALGAGLVLRRSSPRHP
jgi:ketosteroid isomerase-like protein